MPSSPRHYTSQVAFGGCGGMFHYELGVASVIQENFDLEDTAFAGISAGTFPALLCALDMPIAKLVDTWGNAFIRKVRCHWSGVWFNWNTVVRRSTMAHLKEDDYEKLRGKYFVTMTSVRGLSLEPTTIGDWKSNDDLLDGIMASAFIPIFDKWKLTATFRGKRYIDGTVAAKEPRFLDDQNVPRLVINYDMWRPVKKSWLWLSTDESWNRKLYALGRADALKHMAEIAAVLPRTRAPPPSARVL